MDKLVTCKRCGGDACYEQQIDEKITTWLCMGCGFTTSTLMEGKSKVVRDALETSPELYKDLMYTDQDNRTWLPATITLPGKGMVFIDGTTKTSWQWSAVKALPLTEVEIESGRFPKEQTHRMDMKNAKLFGQKDFMDALEQIGFYDLDEN
jgi:hypothetical protein